MGMRLIHNIHFRDKLKRIRTDQWITGIRKALWWLGLCTQAGCIYLALAHGDWLGRAKQTTWAAFTAVLIAGIASWFLCAIVRIIGVRFPTSIDTRQSNITDKSRAIMVGDRHHDIDGARINGISSVGVLYGFGDRKELETAGADFIAADNDELFDILTQ